MKAKVLIPLKIILFIHSYNISVNINVTKIIKSVIENNTSFNFMNKVYDLLHFVSKKKIIII